VRKLALVLVVLLTINLFAGFAMAEEVTVKSISPSPYYDSQPKVWGDYVVWRRAINQNANEYIELKEPSWIMIHDLTTGDTWNITPADTQISGEVYHHAQSPDISNGKVVYEAQTGLNSFDTALFIYNISSKMTWELPILSTAYAHGHLHCISGDWVAYTDIQNGSRQAYLYNYQDRIYRTIMGVNSGNSTYGMVMSNNYVVLTVKNESGAYGIITYGIGTGKTGYITIEGAGVLMATSVYNSKVGIISKQVGEAEWSAQIYVIGTGFIDSFNANGILVWDEQVAYYNGHNIYLMQDDADGWVIIYGQNQRLGDLYKNTVVWSDNENSEALYGDARDDYDIYIRTVITDEEIFIDRMTIVGVIVVIILIAILLRVKMYSGNEK